MFSFWLPMTIDDTRLDPGRAILRISLSLNLHLRGRHLLGTVISVVLHSILQQILEFGQILVASPAQIPFLISSLPAETEIATFSPA
jgi:hypothetical protein